MTKTIVVANEKGGVGKTTTATTMATILREKGYKVLFIDDDPQKNSTDTYQAEFKGVATLYDVLMSDNEDDIFEAIQEKEYGDVISSDSLLTKAEKILSSDSMNGIYCLKEKIEIIKEKRDYDYIIIDTNPTITTLLINALVASDEVIIPLTPSRYAIQGLDELQQTLRSIKKRHNPNLKVKGLLMVKYDKRKRLDKKILKSLNELSDQLEAPMFKTKISQCQKVEDSQGDRVPLIYYARSCTASVDYFRFVSEYLEMEKEDGKV